MKYQTIGILNGKFWSSPFLTTGLPNREILNKYTVVLHTTGPSKNDWTTLMTLKGNTMHNYSLDRAKIVVQASLDSVNEIKEECREKSIARTKIEEAQMWLNKMQDRLDESDTEHDV